MPHARSNYELYDLSLDPGETNNVYESDSEVVKELQTQISEIVARGRSNSGAPVPNDTGYWDDLAWMTAEQYARYDTK
ncbi:MAG: hypothetical protein NXI32_31175, partial [bacterium]|nr:hypothetical protein [bacterium]